MGHDSLNGRLTDLNVLEVAELKEADIPMVSFEKRLVLKIKHYIMKLKKQIIRYSFEFSVIVMGISVSFWLNEWDTRRSDKNQYFKDLISIQNDLKNDSIMFVKVQTQLDRGKLKINQLLSEIELYHAQKIDYTEFSSRIIKIAFLYDNQTFFMTDATFKSLILNNRIDLFPDTLHSLMNDYYESIQKRITDNNHMVDNTAIKYYQEYHPFSIYYANAIIDLGYSEFKARETEIAVLDDELLNHFKNYFNKKEIKKIYTNEKFLIHTSALKNRIYKYDNQISIFVNKRNIIAQQINDNIKQE